MQRLDRPLTLSPHAALKSRADGEILVLPERAIRLGGSGAEILRLCVEPQSGADVVTAMKERYPDEPEIDRVVTTFLEEMLRIGGLVAAAADTTASNR